MLIQWNGSKWTGNDIPDFGTAAPGTPTAVYHAAGRDGTPVCHQQNGGRSVPEHYEPMKRGHNPLHPNVVSNGCSSV